MFQHIHIPKQQNKASANDFQNDPYEYFQGPLEDGWGPQERPTGPFYNIMMFYGVTMLWLGLGTKTTWMGLEKDYSLDT